jgi:pimeloyl-ACP methyl ester carboxylesterase
MTLGKGFLDDLSNVDPLKDLSHLKGTSLIIHGGADEVVPVSEAYIYRQRLGNRSALHVIGRADHTFNWQDWEREVIDVTAKWLKRELS